MENKSKDLEAESQSHTETLTVSNASTRPHEETKSATDTLQLLPFPPEIRHLIYSLVLDVSNDEPLEIKLLGRLTISPTNSPASIGSDLSILLVSKQTYIDAYHIFYRINRFHFDTTTVLFNFLRGIGSIRRQHVVWVSFRSFDDNAKRAFRLLKSCQRLKHLQLRLPYYQPSGYVALREVRGLESVQIYLQVSSVSRRRWAPQSDPEELMKAMKRPRLKQNEIDLDAEIDLFKKRRKVIRKTEYENLVSDVSY